MKKYKSNYMFTIMFQICSLLLSLFPGIFITWLVTNPDDAMGVLYIFPSYIVLILFFTVLGNVIHFIISLFTKHTVCIDEKTITLKGKKILTESMKTEDIGLIVFDHGMITKYGRNIPCSITLINHDDTESLNINNPSFFMILKIKKQCKKAKFKFNNWKWYIIWCMIFTAFNTVLSLFI